MPIHDWTRVSSGGFHNFHQDWTIEIYRALNQGLLPPGYTAYIESEAAAYARTANRISIRHEFGHVVAIIEVVSPGNQDSKQAIGAFFSRAIEFLSNGVNLLIVDLFPPTPRDPDGLHALIWDQMTSVPFDARPADQPSTVASYDAGDLLTAYVNPVAAGDPLPEAPLFLAPGWYVDVPLERTYMAAWDVTPKPLRDLVETPRSSVP